VFIDSTLKIGREGGAGVYLLRPPEILEGLGKLFRGIRPKV
jgi:hypothetical protein